MNTTQTIDTAEQIDARIDRERAIAEQEREKRSASAKAKREAAKKEKPAPAKRVAKREGSMAEFVDAILLAGTTWKDLETRCKAESAKRNTKFGATLGSLKSHVKYRSGQKQWVVKQDATKVKMTAAKN